MQAIHEIIISIDGRCNSFSKEFTMTTEHLAENRCFDVYWFGEYYFSPWTMFMLFYAGKLFPLTPLWCKRIVSMIRLNTKLKMISAFHYSVCAFEQK